MTRDNIINFLSKRLDISKTEINQVLKECYDEYKSSKENFVEEALEDYSLGQFRACKDLIKYLFVGE